MAEKTAVGARPGSGARIGPSAVRRTELSPTRQRLIATARNPMAVIAVAILAFWVLFAAIGPLLIPYTYTEIKGTPWSRPSARHWLGTDSIGRDVLARLATGGRMVVVLPTLSIAVGVLVGSSIGLVTGYLGGLVDDIVMRVMDILMAFPMIMLYLLVIFAIGPSAVNVVWAIAIGSTPGIARLVRGLTLDLRTREFVLAAQMRGESAAYIMFREILPNLMGPVVVDACVRVGYGIFAVGALGYLGLGVPPPMPDWGSMLGEARVWIWRAPWAPVAPIVSISSVIVALNMLTDAMRQAGWTD